MVEQNFLVCYVKCYFYLCHCYVFSVNNIDSSVCMLTVSTLYRESNLLFFSLKGFGNIQAISDCNLCSLTVIFAL